MNVIRLFILSTALLLISGCARKKEEAVPGKIVLEYWRHHYTPEHDAIQEFIADFEAQNPDIKIKLVSIPYSTYVSKLVSSIAAGTGPDVINIHNSWAYSYIKGDNIQPVPESVMKTAEIEREYFPLLSSFRHGDAYYGLPIGGSNLGLFCNARLFKEAGLSADNPPATWTDLIDYANALTRNENDVLLVSGAAIGFPAKQGWNYLVEGLFRQNGSEIINPEGTKVLWDGDAAIAAFTFYTDFIRRWKVYSFDFLRAYDAFQTERAAMVITGSWTLGKLKVDAPELDYRVAPLPKGPRARANYGTYWANCVTKRATGERAAAAWKFIQFITAPEQVRRWSDKVGEIPMLRAFEKDEAFRSKHPRLVPFLEQMEHSYSSLKKDEAAYKAAIVEAVEKVVLKDADPASALRTAAGKVNRMLGEN